MVCTSPLYRQNGKLLDEGIEIPSSYRKRKFLNFKDFNYAVQCEGLNPILYQKLDCGQCLSCRIKHAQMWSERCLFEAMQHDSNYFLTLTYDDHYLPYSSIGVPTLRKKDMQDFMKRFRKKFGKVRFFGCGEYGDQTFRPHYHLLLFGVEFRDLEVYKLSHRGGDIYPYFNSKELDSVWQKGFAVLSRCTPETCSYCARYSLKKLHYQSDPDLARRRLLEDNTLTDKEIHRNLQAAGYLQPVFSLMSRKPGIARDYYEEKKLDLLRLSKVPGSKLSKIRYFDKLLEQDFPDSFINLKIARESLQIEFQHGDYIDEQYLDILREHSERKQDFRGN